MFLIMESLLDACCASMQNGNLCPNKVAGSHSRTTYRIFDAQHTPHAVPSARAYVCSQLFGVTHV